VVIILLLTPDINHGVDRTGAAEQFAPGPVNLPAVEAGIRFGHIHPVERLVVESFAIADGGSYPETFVASAGFEHQYLEFAIGAEAFGQYAAGGSGTYNDKVEFEFHDRCRKKESGL